MLPADAPVKPRRTSGVSCTWAGCSGAPTRELRHGAEHRAGARRPARSSTRNYNSTGADRQPPPHGGHGLPGCGRPKWPDFFLSAIDAARAARRTEAGSSLQHCAPRHGETRIRTATLRGSMPLHALAAVGTDPLTATGFESGRHVMLPDGTVKPFAYASRSSRLGRTGKRPMQEMNLGATAIAALERPGRIRKGPQWDSGVPRDAPRTQRRSGRTAAAGRSSRSIRRSSASGPPRRACTTGRCPAALPPARSRPPSGPGDLHQRASATTIRSRLRPPSSDRAQVQPSARPRPASPSTHAHRGQLEHGHEWPWFYLSLTQRDAVR